MPFLDNGDYVQGKPSRLALWQLNGGGESWPSWVKSFSAFSIMLFSATPAVVALFYSHVIGPQAPILLLLCMPMAACILLWLKPHDPRAANESRRYSYEDGCKLVPKDHALFRFIDIAKYAVAEPSKFATDRGRLDDVLVWYLEQEKVYGKDWLIRQSSEDDLQEFGSRLVELAGHYGGSSHDDLLRRFREVLPQLRSEYVNRLRDDKTRQLKVLESIQSAIDYQSGKLEAFEERQRNMPPFMRHTTPTEW